MFMRIKFRFVAISMLLCLSCFIAASCGGGLNRGTPNVSGLTGEIDGYAMVQVSESSSRAADRSASAQSGYIPLSGATVACGGSTTTTDANGYYMITGIPSGDQTLQISKSGYGSISVSVKVQSGQKTTATQKNSPSGALSPSQSGFLSVSSSPSGASIILDGYDSSMTTPATLRKITVGRHNVLVTLDGYDAGSAQTANIANGQTSSLSFTLTQKSSSSLSVSAMVSPPDGDIHTVFTVACLVSGGSATKIEYRCDDSSAYKDISSGEVATCEYSAAGSYSPGCRVNGSIVNAADSVTITATAVCGNGTVESTEECDDGNAVTETCAYGETSCAVCDSSCASVAGATSFCGDGTVDTGENCDDGNAVTEACAYGETSCTVCNSSCASVAGSTSFCGNGTVDTGENCDDGNAVTEACAYGETSCTVCDSSCASVAGATSFCGNGTIDTGENCDDGNAVTEACAYGETSCTVCDSSCASVAGATSFCGDGTIDTGENCDDGNAVTEACAYGETSCTVCDSSCASVAGATTYCGDGNVDATESCDDGNNADGDGCDSTCANEPATGVTATMSAYSGETFGSLALTCATTGGAASTIEGRCSDVGSWKTISSGNSMECVYRSAGTYTPGCRIDGSITDDSDSSVIITLTTSAAPNYVVVDTNQTLCYPDQGTSAMPNCPLQDTNSLYGQDAQYTGIQPSFTDNGNGTVTDNNTGLTWQQGDNDSGRLGYYEAVEACGEIGLGGYDDWRIPTIKELFSIIDFDATRDNDTSDYYFFSDYFELDVDWNMDLSSDPDHDDPSMMGQTWSSTIYVGNLWGNGQEAAQFMNLLDGHLKANETERATNLYRCVRGDLYGVNDFVNNGDGTVTDNASSLMWQQADDGVTRDWPTSLAYCNSLDLANHSDWRLPNAKELHSITDYSVNTPALNTDYFTQTDSAGWFWSSTSFEDGSNFGIYICFGPCVSTDGTDTHGTGMRGEYKVGDPANYSNLGNQADDVRIYNYARCVRDI